MKENMAKSFKNPCIENWHLLSVTVMTINNSIATAG